MLIQNQFLWQISTEVVFSKTFRKYNLRQLLWQLEYSEVSRRLHYKWSESGVHREYSEITFREWTNLEYSRSTPEIHVRSHYKF